MTEGEQTDLMQVTVLSKRNCASTGSLSTNGVWGVVGVLELASTESDGKALPVAEGEQVGSV